MLHIVNKSPFANNSIKSCINIIDSASAILLIEDGVIAATKNKLSIIDSIASQGRVYALKNDIEARGISSKIATDIKLINYVGFVDLVVKHGTTVSWF